MSLATLRMNTFICELKISGQNGMKTWMPRVEPVAKADSSAMQRLQSSCSLKTRSTSSGLRNKDAVELYFPQKKSKP